MDYSTNKDENKIGTDEEKIVEMVLENKRESLEFYKEKFANFNYYDRLYIRGASQKNTPKGRANLELPTVFQQIEPFVAQMTEGLVSESPYIRFDGRTEADEGPAQQITDFTQYQLDEGGFLESWCTWIRSLGKYGTATMKVLWDTETQTRVRRQNQPKVVGINPETGEPLVEMEEIQYEEEVKTFDGLRFVAVSIFDFFVPPSATGPRTENLDWCIHRTYRDIDQLLLNDNYINKDKLKKIAANYKDSVPSLTAEDQAKKTNLEQRNESGLDKFKGKCEVLEWWGYHKFKENEEAKPALIVVASPEGCEPVLLRFEENPFDNKFMPFITANDYPREGEFYGYGEIDHIKGLVQEGTALRNARLDATNMSLNHMWIVQRSAGINIRNLYSAPNHVILTDEMDGIREINPSGATTSSVEELGRIDFDIQNTTEIINPRQDVSNVGAAFGGTATGVNFLQAKTNLRMLLKTRLLEHTFFKPLARMIQMYNSEMIQDPMYYRVYDAESENPYRSSAILPGAFTSEVDYIPKSNPEKMSKDEKKANLEYLLQTIAQVEGVAPGTIAFKELMPEVFKIAGFPHSRKYMLPEQTQLMQTPDGQLIDKFGKPVQVVPVDEKGQPLPPEQGMM